MKSYDVAEDTLHGEGFISLRGLRSKTFMYSFCGHFGFIDKTEESNGETEWRRQGGGGVKTLCQ